MFRGVDVGCWVLSWCWLDVGWVFGGVDVGLVGCWVGGDVGIVLMHNRCWVGVECWVGVGVGW